jgi:cystine transport system permease protein
LPLDPAAAALYWALSLVFERVQRLAERRLNRAHETGQAAR